MKKNILIVLLSLVFIAISSCSTNKNNNDKKSVGSDSPVTVQENTVQPNY